MFSQLGIFTFYALPAVILTCGSDISGTSSTTAEFNIDFFAPISYSYPPNESDLYPGQSLTLALANTRVKTDLDLAISKALTDNQLFLPSPPTVNFTFSPPQIVIYDGEKCVQDGTYISISGTIIYKCVVTGATTSSSSGLPTTAPPAQLTTSGDGDQIQLLRKKPLPRHRAVEGVGAQPFVQSMNVVATSAQSLFLSQWKQIGRSVQMALEERKLLFNDEISVNLL